MDLGGTHLRNATQIITKPQQMRPPTKRKTVSRQTLAPALGPTNKISSASAIGKPHVRWCSGSKWSAGRPGYRQIRFPAARLGRRSPFWTNSLTGIPLDRALLHSSREGFSIRFRSGKYSAKLLPQLFKHTGKALYQPRVMGHQDVQIGRTHV